MTALSLSAGAFAVFGHLLLALAARRAGGPAARPFGRLALVLALWSAALFLNELFPAAIGATVAWIAATAFVPIGLDLAAAVRGPPARSAWTRRAAIGSRILAGLLAAWLALAGAPAIPWVALALLPGLIVVIEALRRAHLARGQPARPFLVAAALTVLASALDTTGWFGLDLPVRPPRLAALMSLTMVGALGSSVARHRLYALQPILGRTVTLAALAFGVAVGAVETLAWVEPPFARWIWVWCVVLGFALLQRPLLRFLRSPAARAAARRQRAFLQLVADVHRVLAVIGSPSELEPALARHLTRTGDLTTVRLELAPARAPRPPHELGTVRLRLKALERKEGWLLLGFADAALARRAPVRRALRVLADRVATYVGALRLREEKQRAERLAALGAVAAELAHEIRNPLSALLGALDLVEAPGREAGVQRWLAIARDEARRLERTVTDALTLGREPQIERAPVDLRRLVDDVLLLARDRAARTRVDLRSSVMDAIETIDVDAHQLRHALLNLVLNGITVQPAGGRVEVEACRAPGLLVFHVRDDGPGIPAELGARVFEPFFTTRPTGSGLGLAVAERLAAAHGGRLELADPDRGFKGAHFVLKMPLPHPRSEPRT